MLCLSNRSSNVLVCILKVREIGTGNRRRYLRFWNEDEVSELGYVFNILEGSGP